MLNGADIRYANFVQNNYPYVANAFSKTLLKTKLMMRHSACWILAFLLVSLMGCSSSSTCIDEPESIRVYVNNEMSEYFEYEEEYQTVYSNLKCSLAGGVLETAVDEDYDFDKSRCIIFHYSEQQVLDVDSEGIDPVERIFDELVFCYSDPYQGEIILSLDGRLLSGTYRNKSDTWPL